MFILSCIAAIFKVNFARGIRSRHQGDRFDVAVDVRVALILDGAHVLTAQGSWVSSKKDEGFTLVRRTSAGVKSQRFDSLKELLSKLAVK